MRPLVACAVNLPHTGSSRSRAGRWWRPPAEVSV